MRKGVLIAVLLAMASVGVTDASATVLIDSAGRTPQPYQQWVYEAKVPTVAGPVRLIGSMCPDRLNEYGCTGPDQTIYLTRYPTLSTLEFRQEFLHELGHQFDYWMPQWVRDRFQAIMRDQRPWRDVPNAPLEQFAQAYSLCGLGGSLARRYLKGNTGAYDYTPTTKQNRAVCKLIRSQSPPSSGSASP
jgi:hypothetical protein